MNLTMKLKEAREKAGYSQKEVAEKLNISRQSISRWENGWSCPDIENLVILSELYNSSIDELLNKVHIEEKNLEEENKISFCIMEDFIILVAIMCFSAIPCLGLIGIIGLIIYMFTKKKKINKLYQFLIIIFLCISLYNSFMFIKLEFLNTGKATVEKVAFLSSNFSA